MDLDEKMSLENGHQGFMSFIKDAGEISVRSVMPR
jgi:hypothetical protein